MSREAIIRQIVRRDLAQKDLCKDTVRKTESALFEIACDEFGSWETALEYAGIRTHDVARCQDLSPERVKRELRRLCTPGYDLGAKSTRTRDRVLYKSALRHFGSWRSALTAAGVNLANVSRRRPKHLDREALLLWLQLRKTNGQTLVWTEVCLENRNYALATKRQFRSWRKALNAAGVEGAE